MRHDIENRIRQMEWPAPSDSLRARIMAEASPAAAPIVWSDRVWFSRTFRWSVAAAIVGLIGFGQWAGRGPNFPVSMIPPAEIEAIQAAVIDAGLPAADAAVLVRRAVMARQSAPVRTADQISRLIGDR